jgi:hypothetical protein
MIELGGLVKEKVASLLVLVSLSLSLIDSEVKMEVLV